jgi:hypothetical protein
MSVPFDRATDAELSDLALLEQVADDDDERQPTEAAKAWAAAAGDGLDPQQLLLLALLVMAVMDKCDKTRAKRLLESAEVEGRVRHLLVRRIRLKLRCDESTAARIVNEAARLSRDDEALRAMRGR